MRVTIGNTPAPRLAIACVVVCTTGAELWKTGTSFVPVKLPATPRLFKVCAVAGKAYTRASNAMALLSISLLHQDWNCALRTVGLTLSCQKGVSGPAAVEHEFDVIVVFHKRQRNGADFRVGSDFA